MVMCAICQRMIRREWRDIRVIFMSTSQYACVTCANTSTEFSDKLLSVKTYLFDKAYNG